MAIDLTIEPRKTYSWRGFKRATPAFSIALDGIVNQGPKIESQYLNLNHHEEVVREFTFATCMQAYMAIKGGLFQRFQTNGEPTAHLYANDCDEDVCLSAWVLQNYDRFEGTKSDWRLNRLLDSGNKMDVTAGAFPFNQKGTYRFERKWIFDPYRQLRHSGRLFSAPEEEMKRVIAEVGKRIRLYSQGMAEQLELDTEHEILYHDSVWTMAHEIGAESREHLYSEGMNAFVALLHSEKKGDKTKYAYTIGRRSRFIDFPVIEIFRQLNKAERISRFNLDKWGGSFIIGGSPRERGSYLSPPEVQGIVNDVIKHKKSHQKWFNPLSWFR